MFKQTIAFILLLAFVLQTFSRFIIVADFYANQDYIARTLCINKAKLMMHCNGKCQLMKKLDQEEKQNQDSEDRKTENLNHVVSSKSFYLSGIHHCPIIIIITYQLNNEGKPVDRPSTCFHPPNV